MSRFRAGAAHAVQRCADVVNAARHGGGPEVAAALRASGESVAELSAEQVRSLQHSATALHAVAAADTLPDVCALLNRVLATCEPPRLTAHDTTPWHLHIDRDDDADWGEWFLASSAMALAITVAEHQQRPLGVCAAPGCDDVFAALGAGRPRRFCSPACATRARVAAHRSRA